jgi:hypothetical protein
MKSVVITAMSLGTSEKFENAKLAAETAAVIESLSCAGPNLHINEMGKLG